MTAAPPEALTLDRISTPIGTALVVTDEAGVLRAFNWTDYEDAMQAWLAKRYPKASRAEGESPLRPDFEAYFAGELDIFSRTPWFGAGTAFQRHVWDTLCTIPAGGTLSYAGLAERIGRPTAVRAVGLANGSNPVALVVPCHRVIGSNGSLTGYGGGLHRKRWLLEHEGASFADALAA
jgi:methylated-DNA-[protein]-cysteine S-methyltransferase